MDQEVLTDPSDYSDIDSDSFYSSESSSAIESSSNVKIKQEINTAEIKDENNSAHSSVEMKPEKLPFSEQIPTSFGHPRQVLCKSENALIKNARRSELESLCLDELLAKALTYEPDLEWNTSWCRFCGARASKFYLSSPWGRKQLCSIHYTMWKEKELHLSQYNEPKNINSAINKAECTEREYLIDILINVDVNNAQFGNRRSLRRKQNKNAVKIEQISDDYSSSDSDSDSGSHFVSDTSDYSSEHSSFSSSEYDSSDFIVPDTKRRKIKLENTNSKFIKTEQICSKPKERRGRLFDEYKCRDCGKIFESASYYKQHCLSAHRVKKAFHCDQCEKSYLDQKNLDTHIRKIHDKEINYVCDKCKRPFFHKYEWKLHIKSCNSTNWLISCTICDDKFQAQTQWKRHMKNVHNVTQPYVCQLCAAVGKETRYANSGGLRQHIERDHHKIRKFQCKHCPKKFHRKAVLEQHQRVHDGKKPFLCKHCGVRFSQRSSLRQHRKAVHLKQKNYECKYCNKRFGALTGMKSHMVALHNDDEFARFECAVCHKRFYEKGAYLYHSQNAHKAVDPILKKIRNGICPYPRCSKRYFSKHPAESVRYHLVHTHNDRKYAKFECNECGKLFYERTRYKEHKEKMH